MNSPYLWYNVWLAADGLLKSVEKTSLSRCFETTETSEPLISTLLNGSFSQEITMNVSIKRNKTYLSLIRLITSFGHYEKPASLKQ